MVPLVKYFFGIFKKVFLVVFVFSLIIGIFSYFINKDKPVSNYDPVAQSRKDIYAKLNNPELKKTTEGKIALGVTRTMVCLMSGEACTDNPADGDKNFKKSAFGVMAQLMAFPYMNPPASGAYWASDTLQNAGLVPKTYAAEGIGFSSIKAFMNLWKVFRDVTYLLLVLFLVAIGFMIMFRVKINPQTVISVENTLPKIVVTMLLITFSFAISGLLIDLMYLLIAISISIISNNNYYYSTQEFQKQLMVAGPGRLIDALMGSPLGYQLGILNDVKLLSVPNFVAQSLSMTRGYDSPLTFLMFFGRQFLEFLGPFISGIIDVVLGSVFALFLAPKINDSLKIDSLIGSLSNIDIATFSGGTLNLLLQNPFATLLVTVCYLAFSVIILPLLIGLLFFFTIIYVAFRIFFLLFTSYIQIILLIIFSPFLIALDLVPGSKMGFGQWLKNLIGELIAFPVVIVIFLISHVLMLTLSQTMTNTNVVSSLSTSTNYMFSPPYLSGIDPKALGMIISLGLALVIPDFVKSVKEGIGAKGLGVNIGLGAFFAGAGAAVGGGMGLVGQYSSIAMAFPQLRAAITSKGGPLARILGNPEPPPQNPNAQGKGGQVHQGD